MTHLPLPLVVPDTDDNAEHPAGAAITIATLGDLASVWIAAHTSLDEGAES